MLPFGVTVTVIRPGGVDRYGQPLPGTRHDIAGCAVAPRSTTESVGGEDIVTDALTLYAPSGADITATDRVSLPGYDGEYDVDGAQQRWASPFTGWTPGDVIQLIKVTG